MATPLSQLELEILPELEAGHEHEFGMGEYEDEAFLGGLLKGVGSALGLGEYEDELGYSGEFEDEYEAEDEFEYELNPIRRVYPDALMEMEHLGHMAAEAEGEYEAGEAFLPLIPLALKALPMALKAAPKVFSMVSKVAPKLTRGVRGLTRTLARNPRTRALTRAVPTIARRTTVNLARQAARGRVITPQVASSALARQTRQVLGNPQACASALKRARTIDRRFHQSGGVSASPAAMSFSPGVSAVAGMGPRMSRGRKHTTRCWKCGALG